MEVDYHYMFEIMGKIFAGMLALVIGWIILSDLYHRLVTFFVDLVARKPHHELSSIYNEPAPVKRGPGRPRKQV